MKVSIIVNNYNYGSYLAAAVDSALAQTLSCEVIIVDDGSTDCSRELIKKYTNRARIILKENGGQSSAFNAGFDVATGDLIVFLDSDDLLFPDAVETALGQWVPDLVKMQYPLRIVMSDGTAIDAVMPRCRLSEGNLLPSFLETGRYVSSPTSGNMFSRSFLSQIMPIPEKQWEAADAYINTAAPFFGRIGAIHKPLGSYRVHGANMTSVFKGGPLDFGKLEKLMRHAKAEERLLRDLACQRGVVVSTRAMVSHWMHLKLLIAYHKSSHRSLERSKRLFTCTIAMIKSIVITTELSVAYKVRYLLWTLCVVFSPARIAEAVIRFGFNPVANTKTQQLVRRG